MFTPVFLERVRAGNFEGVQQKRERKSRAQGSHSRRFGKAAESQYP